MIRIGASVLDQIKSHAEREYPRECCGLLVGRIEDEGRSRVVLEIYAASNSWDDLSLRDERSQLAPGDESTTERRMFIAPDDYRRAELDAMRRGLGVVGDYHSHPDHPARPSQFDLEHSPWPGMSYIIVSVREGSTSEVRSWELAADRSDFNEEELTVVQS